MIFIGTYARLNLTLNSNNWVQNVGVKEHYINQATLVSSWTGKSSKENISLIQNFSDEDYLYVHIVVKQFANTKQSSYTSNGIIKSKSVPHFAANKHHSLSEWLLSKVKHDITIAASVMKALRGWFTIVIILKSVSEKFEYHYFKT